MRNQIFVSALAIASLSLFACKERPAGSPENDREHLATVQKEVKDKIANMKMETERKKDRLDVKLEDDIAKERSKVAKARQELNQDNAAEAKRTDGKDPEVADTVKSDAPKSKTLVTNAKTPPTDTQGVGGSGSTTKASEKTTAAPDQADERKELAPMTLRGTFGGMTGSMLHVRQVNGTNLSVTTSDATKFVRDGKDVVANDLKKGDNIEATYVMKDQTERIAQSIEVLGAPAK